MPDVLTELERSWRIFSRSSAGAAALTRWGTEAPELAPFDNLDRFVEAAQGVGDDDLDGRDELQLALLRCARHDHEARFAVLEILRPGIGRLARRSAHRWGFQETAAMTIALTMEAIVAYPLDRPRPAACILRHVGHELWLQQARELRTPTRIGRVTALNDHEWAPATQTTSAGEEVLDLVGDAVRAGKVTAEHGRFVILHRVLGVPTREVAAQLGRPPSTIRQQRSRAEAVIARFALAQRAVA